MNLVDIIISAGRCSTEEEATDAIASILSPSTNRNEMSTVYKTVLGYNPISFFSENEIKEYINDILRDNENLRSYLQSEDIAVDRIADLALNIHQSHIRKDELLSIKEAIWALCPSLPKDIYETVMDIEVPSDSYDNPSDIDDDDDDDFEIIEEDSDDGEGEEEEEYD